MSTPTLLLSLFEDVNREPNGIPRRRFLVNHADAVNEIERLIEAGTIQCRDGQHLRLPLLELAALAGTVPEAEQVVYLCGRVFEVLRAAYIADTDKYWTVPEIATRAEMPQARVAVAFGYLLDVPIWESWQMDPAGLHTRIVISERILKYRSWAEAITALHALRGYTREAAQAVYAAIETLASAGQSGANPSATP
jgi:hypothetical protein